MSCSLTADAVRDRTKTVTRRRVDTWRTLKASGKAHVVVHSVGEAAELLRKVASGGVQVMEDPPDEWKMP